MTSPTLFERIANVLKLLLPDRAIKFFPPDFTIRRPVLSLLDKSLGGNNDIFLVLFRLEFSRLQHEVPREVWASLHEAARRHLRMSAAEQLSQHELVVLDQFDRTDYVLLFQIPHTDGNSEYGISKKMNDKLDRIRTALEVGLHGAAPEWRLNLRVVKSYAPITDSHAGTAPAELLKEAYRLALALATRQVTPKRRPCANSLNRCWSGAPYPFWHSRS